jgi:hypothetical protein
MISTPEKNKSMRVSPLPKPNIDSSSSKRKWVNLQLFPKNNATAYASTLF